MTAVIVISIVVGCLFCLLAVFVMWDVFVPKRCSECRKRALVCLNFVRATPGPSYSTFRCSHCGEEYAQVDGAMEVRKGSRWEGAFGWGPASGKDKAHELASGRQEAP